jgi:hypothetical protein
LLSNSLLPSNVLFGLRPELEVSELTSTHRRHDHNFRVIGNFG